jgi:hypothetical protein
MFLQGLICPLGVDVDIQYTDPHHVSALYEYNFILYAIHGEVHFSGILLINMGEYQNPLYNMSLFTSTTQNQNVKYNVIQPVKSILFSLQPRLNLHVPYQILRENCQVFLFGLNYRKTCLIICKGKSLD